MSDEILERPFALNIERTAKQTWRNEITGGTCGEAGECVRAHLMSIALYEDVVNGCENCYK